MTQTASVSTRSTASRTGGDPAPSPPPLAPGRDHRWQTRLVVTIPALLILFILAYGMVSYLAFNQSWDELGRLGALEVGSRLLRTHLVAMLVLAALALTAGLALSWSILRPLRALAQTARQVADGRLDRLAPQLPATRELEDFSRTFNTMIAHLSHTISERNRCLVEGIPIGILTTDMEGRINALNPVAAALLGVELDAVIGRTVGELGRHSAGMARAIMAHLDDKLGREESFTGHEFSVSGSEGEFSLIISAAYMRDHRQTPLGVVFNLRESSQVHNLTAHLSQTDQLAMLGTFALGLAHQLRNPLGAVKGLSQLLATRPGIPGEIAPYLERMGREVDRADKVVIQLLDLAQPPEILAQHTDVPMMIERAIDRARQGLPDNLVEAVTLLTDLAPLPPPLVQTDRLSDAFAQIIRNAYQFTPPGGQIHVRARGACGQTGSNGRRPCWEVRVENTGPAIAPGDLPQLFDPFYTTHEHATGLGLTIARQIVTQNGGRLEAKLIEGGVAFIATFAARDPVADEAAAAGPMGGTA